MAYIGSSYLVGLFFASFLSCDSYGITVFIAVGTLSAALAVWMIFRGKYAKQAVCIAAAGAAMMLYGLYGIKVYKNIIGYDGLNVEIFGTVTGYAEYSGDKASYVVKGVINSKTKAEVMFYTDSCDAEIGDIVIAAGSAEIPEDKYTFPAESYYKAKGIYLRINKITSFRHMKSSGFSLRRTLDRYREYIISRIGVFMDTESMAVMSAMLFGDRSELDSSAKTLMYRAGIGHIMAVSGVHISVLCAFFNLFISRIKAKKLLRFVLIMTPVCCFAMLAGMSNSVMRAAFMSAVVYGAELFRRRADTYNSLGVAVILLTAANPFAVRDASFLLSVMGVFGVAVVSPEAVKLAERKNKISKTAKGIITSLCTSAVIFPVSMLFFDEVSVVSPISNLLLMPVCTLIMICGLIVTLTGGVTFIALPVLKICEALCRFVLWASGFIGRLHFSYIPLGNGFAKAMVIASVCAAVCVLAVTKKTDLAAVSVSAMFIISTILINIYKAVPDNSVKIAVLKDGSSVTALVHGKSSASVIDLHNSGKASSAAVKYLNRLGIYDIECLLLDEDANVSLPVYSAGFELFDVEYVMIPEGLAAFSDDNYFDGRIYTYSYTDSIETENYTVSLENKGVILITIGEKSFVFYDSDCISDSMPGSKYDGAVKYAGKSDTELNAEITAKMNESNTKTKNGRDTYITESFIMTVDGGTVKTGLLR